MLSSTCLITRGRLDTVSKDRRSRGHRLQLAGLFSGIVAVVASWLIGIPKIRDLGEELGAEMPAIVNVLVDHGGTITTVAVLVAIAGIAAMEVVKSHAVRNSISIATSLILFVLFFWDMGVFWLVYSATLDGIG